MREFLLNRSFRVTIQANLFAILMGSSPALYAGTADAFDGVWLSVRETAALTKGKVPDWSEGGPWSLSSFTYKADSGKNKCFLHIVKSIGEDYAYEAKSFCNINGAWERDGKDTLWDLSFKGGVIIGSDWFSMYLAQNGFSAKGDGAPWLGYEGSMSFSAKVDRQGVITRVKASSASQGMFNMSDSNALIMGTGKGSLKVGFVPLSVMQAQYAGAIECQEQSDSLNGKTPTDLCD
jgi:hypothetical protein